MWRVAWVGLVLLLSRPAAAQCSGNVPAGFNAQVGLLGASQECGSGTWTGLAFAIQTGGGMRDTVRFSLNTNRGGGDVYVMGNTPDPNGIACGQPDVTDIRASWCCALEGLSVNVQPATHNPHDLVAPAPFATEPAGTPTWIVFVKRSGRCGVNSQGIPNGTNFPSHQVARDSTQPSVAGRAFANLFGTGNPGDWLDLVTLNPVLGTPYDVTLLSTGGAPSDPDNCDSVPVGACCNDAPGCTILRPWECGVFGGLYNGDGTTCDAPPLFECTCGVGGGNCLVADPKGNPGCGSMGCCKVVCFADPYCCSDNWDAGCAATATLPANSQSCFPDLASPAGLELSNRFAAGNGRLRVRPDAYGSWTSTTFGGPQLGDNFDPGPGNPGPDQPPLEATFSTGTFLFADLNGDGTNDARELLTSIPEYNNVTEDTTLLSQVLTNSGGSDTNGNGANDTAMSSFRVVTPDQVAMDLTFGVVQSVADGDDPNSAVYTLEYTISNNTATPVTLKLLRHLDANLAWVSGGSNDSVGTDANSGGGDYGVFTNEPGLPNTRIHITNASSTVYAGSKGGIDPDRAGPCEAYGYGTDIIFWNAFGITDGDGTTDCWANHIALVGTGVDGESGEGLGDPTCDPCDGMILLEEEVTIPAGPGPGVVVTFRYTYGAPPAACAWDCQAVPDDNVGINDLLDLLAAWGAASPCDFDGGGVGITDLLNLLASWGKCQ